MRRVFFTYPDLGHEEAEMVRQVLRSGMVSYGKASHQFEEELARYIGCKHVVVVNNGTSGLVATLMVLDVKRDDEVIVPAYTYIATANAVVGVGAAPVFVDVDETFNINVGKIEEKITEKTKAIIAVDVAGMPCDLKGLREICDDHGLSLVEDAAESLGAEYEKKKVGGIYSDAAVFSFHASKIITTGEGGAIATNDDRTADKLKLIVRQGILGGTHYNHVCFGLNFKLTDIQSAVGICQLRKIERFISNRIRNVKRYESALAGMVGFQKRGVGVTRSVWWVLQVLFEDKEERDRVLQWLIDRGVEAKVCWKPPPLQSHLRVYNRKNETFTCAEDLANRVVSLPTGNNLQVENVNYVIEQIKAALDQ